MQKICKYTKKYASTRKSMQIHEKVCKLHEKAPEQTGGSVCSGGRYGLYPTIRL